MLRNVIIIICFLILRGDVLDTAKTALSFDVILRNKVVGNLETNQITKDGITYYQSSTNIKTRLVKEILVSYEYAVAFENKALKKADVAITVNKKAHAKTQTKWVDDHYQITKNDKEETVLNSDISYATILLYFIEPINISSCYSEQDGSFNTIVPLENHSYKKINSKGKENTYYYKNGILKKAIIDGGLISFEMIAREY